MGKSKAKKLKATQKKEITSNESKATDQQPKSISPKPKKQKQEKPPKTNQTGFTIPLIIFSFITLLLGIAIVLVSEHLESRPLTQPPKFKIIYENEILDIKKQDYDIDKTHHERQSQASQAESNEQIDSLGSSVDENNIEATSAPDEADKDTLIDNVGQSTGADDESTDNKVLDDFEGQLREDIQSSKLLEPKLEEDMKLQEDLFSDTFENKQDELRSSSLTDVTETQDVTEEEQKINVIQSDSSQDETTNIIENKEDNPQGEETQEQDDLHVDDLGNEQDDGFANRLETVNFKDDKEPNNIDNEETETEEEQNIETLQSIDILDTPNSNNKGNLGTDTPSKEEIQEDEPIKENEEINLEDIIEIKDEDLDDFGSLKDEIINFSSSDEQKNKDQNKENENAPLEQREENPDEVISEEKVAEQSFGTGQSKKEDEAEDSEEPFNDDQIKQNDKDQQADGSQSSKKDKVLIDNQSTDTESSPADEKKERSPTGNNHDLADEETASNQIIDENDQQEKKEVKVDQHSINDNLNAIDKNEDQETKLHKITDPDHQINHTKTSHNISSNATTTDTQITKDMSFFHKPETNDEIENIDIIFQQPDDEDQKDDDEESESYETIFETEPEEQTYHVEEKRIKIIKDSQYVPITDGVRKHVLREGYGTVAKQGDQVTLHCMGYIDKIPPKLFWNTKELGQRPFKFVIGEKQVIKGWDEAVATMKLLERSKFKIEAKKAYGKYGFGAWDIPPDADLIMDFQLMDITRSFSKSRKDRRISRNR